MVTYFRSYVIVAFLAQYLVAFQAQPTLTLPSSKTPLLAWLRRLRARWCRPSLRVSPSITIITPMARNPAMSERFRVTGHRRRRRRRRRLLPNPARNLAVSERLIKGLVNPAASRPKGKTFKLNNLMLRWQVVMLKSQLCRPKLKSLKDLFKKGAPKVT